MEYLVFISSSILLALTPGPDNVFVMLTSLNAGFYSALKFIFGLVTGILIHTSLIIVGISELIKKSQYGLTIIKIFGFCYLIWLAYLTFINRKQPLEMAQNHSDSINYYFRGLIMNLTNPKILLFFLAFLPSFAQLELPGFEQRLLLLGAIFSMITVLVFGLLAWVADKGIKQRIQNPQMVLTLNWVTIIIFTAMALLIAIQ